MLNFLRSFTYKSLILLNFLFGILFIACCFAPEVHPQKWWPAGFFGLFLPYLFFLMFLFFFIWIFIRPFWTLLPLSIIAFGSFQLRTHYTFNKAVDFDKTVHGDLRVMSWNVRHFIPFNETKFKPRSKEQPEKIFNAIRDFGPDVICLQEFISIPSLGESDPLQYLKENLGYKYVQFEGEDIFGNTHRSGNAIFSRIPIVQGGVIKFPPDIKGQTENMVYADLLTGNDTIRVYSVHLKSFGFGEREYKAIEGVRTESETDISESKNVLRKMRNTFRWHGLQADFVKDMTSLSPYKFVLAGDLNDVPTSYAYKTIKNKLKDAFIEKGSGLGATFLSATSSFLRILPTLRIDYIFADQSFSTLQFMKGGERISDHFFLIADFSRSK